MPPQEVAEAGYDAVMRGDRIFVPGGLNKAMVFARRVMSIPAQAKLNKKMYEDAPPEKRTRHRGDIQAEAQRKHRRTRVRPLRTK